MPGFNDVPFNFVPLNHEVFIPEWGYKISQDVPFEDGEDGIIKFKIKNITPLYIHNVIKQDSGEADAWSAHVVIKSNGSESKVYYIPATSLKGMVRSAMEILSFGWLRQYNDSEIGRHHIKEGIKQTGYNMKGEKTSETNMDLPECIFGCVRDKQSLRGRVQFGNAFTRSTIKELDPETGVLGLPQASYYPYYLKHSNGRYSTYSSENIEIAGRKRYRIRRDEGVSQLNGGREGSGTLKTIRPLPCNIEFDCEIRLHNMRPVEIGALLSALTFHGTECCYHNIGMCKPLGYGKIKIYGFELVGLNNAKNYYMKEYEKCMVSFYYRNVVMRKGLDSTTYEWSNSEQVTMLRKIAAEHEKPIAYPSSRVYQKAKAKNAFYRLSEPEYNNCSESFIDGNEYKNLLDEVDASIENDKRGKEQCNVPCNRVVAVPSSQDNESDNEQNGNGNGNDVVEAIPSIQNEGSGKKQTTGVSIIIPVAQEKTATERGEEKRRKKEAKQQWKAEKDVDLGMAQSTSIEEDLMTWLEKKDKSGNSVKRLLAIVKNFIEWKKSKGLTCVSQQVIEELETSMRHIYSMKMKDEYRKEWQAFTSDPWRMLVSILGEDNARRIFNKIINNE